MGGNTKYIQRETLSVNYTNHPIYYVLVDLAHVLAIFVTIIMIFHYYFVSHIIYDFFPSLTKCPESFWEA